MLSLVFFFYKISPHVPVAEYTNEYGRLHLYVAGWVLWVFGICFLSLVAWASRHWFVYGLATTLPNLLLFVFWWCVFQMEQNICRTLKSGFGPLPPPKKTWTNYTPKKL